MRATQSETSSNNRKQGREHYLWQEMMVARTDLTAVEKTIAWRLALFRNVKTGQCNPSYTGLAGGAGASERTAKRAIAKFERLGLIAVERTRGGSLNERNQYRLIMPGVSAQTPLGVSTATAGGVSGRARRGVRARPEGVSELCHPNTKENMGEALTEPPQHGERENALTRDDSPLGGGGRPDGAAPQDSGRGLPRKEESQSGFAELRTVWARPWVDDPEADREAYARAVKEGADPEEILTGARASVAAADAPRFLPKLAVWIERKGWLKPPPPKRAQQKGSRNGWRKPDACKVVLGMVGYVEGPDGRMVRQ